MGKPFLLGIDAGTSFVKTVVFDQYGREIGLSREPVPVETTRQDWAEQDMDLVWRAARKTIANCLKDHGISAKRTGSLEATFQPNMENHQKYRELYRLYQGLYQHLWDDWDTRAEILN